MSRTAAPLREHDTAPRADGADAAGASVDGAVCPNPAVRTRCLHCGLRLSPDQVAAGRDFCCTGCERVHALLQEAGLARYYDLRTGPGVPAPEFRPDTFAWLDPLVEADATPGDRPRSLTLDLQGVHCAACVWLLETLFKRFPGAVSLRINSSLGKADVAWIPAKGDLRTWLAEAESFGYRFGPSRKSGARRSGSLILRLGITVAAAVHVMMFSLAYYLGLSAADGIIHTTLGWLSLIFATVAVTVGGSVFLRAAWRGVRRRVVHLDLPIAAGIVLAYGGSVYAYFRHGPEAAYFDTVSIFVTLMLVGRWLQERVLERNRNALLADGGVDQLFTRRMENGTLRSAPAVSVRRSDELWIVPGDLAPVRGIVVDRAARVSLDWITGESDAIEIPAGGAVPAGAFNAGDSPIRLSAGEDFADSRLNDLLRTGASTPEDEGVGTKWWSRLGTGYVAAIFLFAALGFLIWLPRGVERAMEVTVAILVVTCPCALGLAVPLAQELVHLALQRRGVFLRRARFLDRALSVRTVLFDKTGTLSLGRLVPTRESADALRALALRERAVLGFMTGRSNHPVSRTLAEALRANGTDAPDPGPGALRVDGTPVVDDTAVLREIPGSGLELELEGRRWRLGSPAFAGAESDTAGPGGGSAAGPGAPGSGTRTVFSVDGIPVAAFAFEEHLKGDAAAEIARLREAGHRVVLLSGDRSERVAEAARRLGLDTESAEGGLSPEAKAARVRDLDARDTLMVGDGINDGPSFAAAWTAATPAVDHPSIPARADFYFLGEGIAAVRRALEAARRLRRITRDNLIFAVAYNAAALALCYVGVVTPVVAAVLMPVSSVAIVSLTARRLSGERLSWMS